MRQLTRLEEALASAEASIAVSAREAGMPEKSAEGTAAAPAGDDGTAETKLADELTKELADLIVFGDTLRGTLARARANLAMVEGASRVLGPTTVVAVGGSVAQSGSFGAIVGVLFGGLVALALGFAKVPATSVDEMEELTGMTVLGSVDESATTARQGGAPDVRLEIIAAALAERASDAGCSTVVLAPASNGTNVDQIARDLARGLAARGAQVAVVDADGTATGDGLAQLADPGTRIEAVSKDVSVGLGSIVLMSPGHTPVPFSSWLGSSEAARAMTALGEDCALSLLVAPPLHRDASGLLMASQTDALVLVIPAAMSRSQAVRIAEETRRMDLAYAEVLVVSGSKAQSR